MPLSIFSSFSSSSSVDASFVESWSVLDKQLPHIECLEVSKTGVWLLSASEDHTLLFIQAKTGRVAGSLDLEKCFRVLCCIWTSDQALFAGGTNGVVYEIILNSRSVSFHVCYNRALLNICPIRPVAQFLFIRLSAPSLNRFASLLTSQAFSYSLLHMAASSRYTARV